MLNSSQCTPVRKFQHSNTKSAILSRFLRPLYYQQGYKECSSTWGERGLALLEALIATAIVGTTLVATVMGQVGGSTSTEANLDVTTSTIARAQLESVYKAEYIPHPATYPSVPVANTYAVTARTVAIEGADPNIEKVIVTVSKDGQVDLVMETFKTRKR